MIFRRPRRGYVSALWIKRIPKRGPPPFWSYFLHLSKLVPGILQGPGTLRAPRIFVGDRLGYLLPALRNVHLEHVFHLMEAGVVAAAVAFKGGGRFERVHHESVTGARDVHAVFLRARAARRNVGHLGLC